MARTLVGMLIAVALFVAPCRGATMFYLPDAKLLALATAVAVGDVISVHAEPVPGRQAVRSRVRLAVTEWVKTPERPTAELEILTPGGAAGGVETRVPGAPRFVAGERALVFLAPHEDDGWRVVGMTRGKYRVLGTDAQATVRLDLEGLTQLDPETGREIPADLIPASAGRVYLADMVAMLRQCQLRPASAESQ